MAVKTKIHIRGKIVALDAASFSKADLARALLDLGYTVSEISKAVPMAYSQVHSIHQKDQQTDAKARASVSKPKASREDSLIRAHGMKPQEVDQKLAWTDPTFGRKKATKPAKSPMVSRARVGKLRTPGFPSDLTVGECANCGHDLVVRGLPTGFVLVHTNISAEEHLAVTQFCQAMPKVLLP